MTEYTPPADESMATTSTTESVAESEATPIDDLLDAIRQKRETLEALKSELGESAKETGINPPAQDDSTAVTDQTLQETILNSKMTSMLHMNTDCDEMEEEEVIEEVSVCTADLGPEDDLSYQEVWEEEIIDDDEDEPFTYEDVSSAFHPVVYEKMALQEAKAVEYEDEKDMYVEEEVTESQVDPMDQMAVTEATASDESKLDAEDPIKIPDSVPLKPAPLPAPLIAMPQTVVVQPTPPTEEVTAPAASVPPVNEKRKERYNKLGNRLKHIWKPPSEYPSSSPALEVSNSKHSTAADLPATSTHDNQETRSAQINGEEINIKEQSKSDKKARRSGSAKRQKSISKMLGLQRPSESKGDDEKASTMMPDPELTPKRATPKRQKSLSKLLGGVRQKSLSKQDTESVEGMSPAKPAPRRQKSFSKLISGMRQKSDPDDKKVCKVAVRQLSTKSSDSDSNAKALDETMIVTTEESIVSEEKLADNPQEAVANCVTPAAETSMPTERAPEEEKITIKTSTRIVDGKAVTTTTKTTWRVSRQPSTSDRKEDPVTSVTQSVSQVPSSPKKYQSCITPTTPQSSPYRVSSRFPPPSPQDKDIGWSKPEWAIKPVLRKTKMGEAIRSGEK